MDSGNDADANHTHDTSPINSTHEEINAQPIVLTCMGQTAVCMCRLARIAAMIPITLELINRQQFSVSANACGC